MTCRAWLVALLMVRERLMIAEGGDRYRSVVEMGSSKNPARVSARPPLPFKITAEASFRIMALPVPETSCELIRVMGKSSASV